MARQHLLSTLVLLLLSKQVTPATASCTAKEGQDFFTSSCEQRRSAWTCCGDYCVDSNGCDHFCCWEGNNADNALSFDSSGVVRMVLIVLAGFFFCCCCICCLCCVAPTYFIFKHKDRLLGDDDASDPADAYFPHDGASPQYWINQDLDEGFDERYEEEDLIPIVQQMFDATWKDVTTRDRKGGTPIGLEVVGVQRFEDSEMWAAYLRNKEKIAKRGRMQSVPELDGDMTKGHVLTDVYAPMLARGVELDRKLNEHYLFHGTSPHAAENIAEDGFRINLAGKNAGTMFGKGAYLAECSSKADEYAVSGSGTGPLGIRGFAQGEDEYAILLCRVCCGNMFRALRASDKNAFLPMVKRKQIDSVLGDREASVGTYREFVVFKEAQIYPEYRVLYRRLYGNAAE